MHKSILGIALLTAGAAAPLQGATFAAFDGGGIDTPVTLQRFGEAPGPSIDAGGGTSGVAGDGSLVVTPAVNGQNNYATFNRTDTGVFRSSNFNFTFKIEQGTTLGTADGVSFAYLPTSIYGATGPLGSAPFGAAEDPAAPGVLGIGFDTWSNGAPYDTPGIPTGSDYSEISLFWDGNLIQRLDNTRTLNPGFAIDDGVYHVVSGTVDFTNRRVSMSVDGVPIFTNVSVPSLTSFESRVAFAGRTGGENEIFRVDDVFVEWIPVPEPTAALLGALGVGMILRRRRS